MSSKTLWKHTVIFAFSLLLGLSNFSTAQEKKDKILSKDLQVTTLKITGID